MNKVAVLLSFLLLVATVQAPPPDPVPTATVLHNSMQPDDVIRAFVTALSVQRDVSAAACLVEGGLTGAALGPVAEEFERGRGDWTFKVLRSDVQMKDNVATAKVMLVLQHHLFGKMMLQERLTLRQTETGWKIAPLPADEISHSYRDYADSDILANIATYLARS